MRHRKAEPRYAPGIEDKDIIPLATDRDRKNNNVTKETRVFLDENDPSVEGHKTRL